MLRVLGKIVLDRSFAKAFLSCTAMAFAAVSVCTLLEAQREYSLFRSIVRTEAGYRYELDLQKEVESISSVDFGAFPLPVRLMNATYLLLRDRGQALSARKYPLRQGIYSSGLDHLQTGMGACASFAWVLAELLQVAGYESRMAQLRCKDQPTCYCGPEELCHTVVEVLDAGRWVVLDPVRNLFYLNSSGQPASMAEIGSSAASPFLSFQGGLAPEYKYVPLSSYDLRGDSVVYTNWKKLPVVGGAISDFLAAQGMPLYGVSLRSKVLNGHLAVGIMSLLIASVCLVLRARLT